MTLRTKISAPIYTALALVGIFSSLLSAADREAVVEAAKKDGALVVYTVMTVGQTESMLGVFKTKYPFLQTKIFRALGERLLTKIMTEAQAGRYEFDVVQSAETQAYFLKKKNLLMKYVSSEARYVREGFVDPEGYWAAVYVMPNIIGYNTQMVRRSEVPRNNEDLLNPKWKGKIGMDPTKPEWFAWMVRRLGEEKGLAYMRRLAAQEVRLTPGLSLLTNLMASGEFPLTIYNYLNTD